MSRSRRKHPVMGNCVSASEHPYKRLRAARERARLRGTLASGSYEAAGIELAPFDEWATRRDGNYGCHACPARYLRK